MGKSRRKDEWIKEIRDSLADDEAGEVIIPGVSGSHHIRLTKDEIDAYTGSHKKRLSRQGAAYRWIIISLLSALAIVFTGIVDREIQTFIASEQYADIQAERDAAIEAFDLYAEFTRDIVADHRDGLSQRLDQLGVGARDVLASAAQTTGIGGLSSSKEGVGRVLADHLDNGTARNLHEIARIEAFLERLPAATPLKGSHMTSAFGMREHPVTGQVGPHRGIDLVSWDQPTVIAAAPGRVTFAGADGKSGNMVVIDHGLGIKTYYLHLARIDVERNQHLDTGDALGLMGDTGETNGAHLHYEVRIANKHLNPKKVFEVTANAQ